MKSKTRGSQVPYDSESEEEGSGPSRDEGNFWTHDASLIYEHAQRRQSVSHI